MLAAQTQSLSCRKNGKQDKIRLTDLLLLSQGEGLGCTCAILLHACRLLLWVEVLYSCFSLTN